MSCLFTYEHNNQANNDSDTQPNKDGDTSRQSLKESKQNKRGNDLSHVSKQVFYDICSNSFTTVSVSLCPSNNNPTSILSL